MTIATSSRILKGHTLYDAKISFWVQRCGDDLLDEKSPFWNRIHKIIKYAFCSFERSYDFIIIGTYVCRVGPNRLKWCKEIAKRSYERTRWAYTTLWRSFSSGRKLGLLLTRYRCLRVKLGTVCNSNTTQTMVLCVSYSRLNIFLL